MPSRIITAAASPHTIPFLTQVVVATLISGLTLSPPPDDSAQATLTHQLAQVGIAATTAAAAGDKQEKAMAVLPTDLQDQVFGNLPLVETIAEFA